MTLIQIKDKFIKLDRFSIFPFILGFLLGIIFVLSSCTVNDKNLESTSSNSVQDSIVEKENEISKDEYNWIQENDLTGIFFNSNSSELFQSQKNKIDNYLKYYSQLNVSIILTAYCDSTENRSIGDARIASVKEYLKNVNSIKEINKCTDVILYPSVDALNRKVIIRVSSE